MSFDHLEDAIVVFHHVDGACEGVLGDNLGDHVENYEECDN